MKRLSLLLAIFFLIVIPITALAYGPGGKYVSDQSGLLSDEQLDYLNERAQSVSNQYNCDVIVYYCPDSAGNDIETYSEWIYSSYQCGYGEEKSGVMLVVTTDEREYDIVAFGYGNTAFTDYGKYALEDYFLDYLRYSDWYQAADGFITGCERLLYQAANDAPLDYVPDENESDYYYDYEPDHDYSPNYFGRGFLALSIGAIVALISCSIMKSKMKTTAAASSAFEYVAEGGLNLINSSDNFINTTRSRMKVAESRSPSSGSRPGGGSSFHGGTSVNSGGFSHHSGKF